MIKIAPTKYIKLILLIWLTSWFTEIHCQNENNTIQLGCKITTSHKHANGTGTKVRKISAVNKCSEEYQNLDIIKKCENIIDSNALVNNFRLYKPVTNVFKNITYWNEYCAFCNNETELEYWPSWSKLNDLELVCRIYELEVLIGSAADDLHEMTRNFIKKGLTLISKSENSTQLQCSVKENWPMNLLAFIVPCLTNQFRNSQQTRLNSCQYFKKNGRICLKMRLIIEGMDFVVSENGKISIFDESLNTEFTRTGYSIESGIDNVIYVCEKNEMNYGVLSWLEIIAIIFSIIFIVFYLFMNFSKRYFQSFPNKIIYSYSIGLLVMYVFLTFVYVLFPQSCVGFFLAQFSWFFHFFWTMIISLEFCRLTYCTIRKRKVTVSAQPKRYLVYCFLGYVIPTMLPIVYFFILETPQNRCPKIPDHFGVPCKPSKNSAAKYFMETLLYLFDISLFFIIPVLFVLQACVLIYVTKCGPTRIRSTANRNHLIVLMKMAYIMGAHWMLYVFCVWYGYDRQSVAIVSASIVSQLSIDLQGVFVFFAFGFKKSMLTEVLYKCKCKKRSTQQSISAGTGTTVQFQSSSVQINDSKEITE